MKKLTSIVLFFLLLSILSSTSYASKLPGAVSLKWKSTPIKADFLDQEDATINDYGYTLFYKSGSNYNLSAFDKTGKLKLTYKLNKTEHYYESLNHDAMIGSDNSVYFSYEKMDDNNYYGHYVKKISNQGKVLWDKKVGNTEGDIYFASGPKGKVYFRQRFTFVEYIIGELDPKNGKELWRYKWNDDYYSQLSYNKDKDIFVILNKDTVSVVKSGQKLWSKKIPKSLSHIGHISKNGDIALSTLAIGGETNLIQVYSLSGLLKWQYKLPKPVAIETLRFNDKDQLLIQINPMKDPNTFMWLDSKGKMFSSFNFAIPKKNNVTPIYVDSNNFVYLYENLYENGNSFTSVKKVDKTGKLVAQTKLLVTPFNTYSFYASFETKVYDELLANSSSNGKFYIQSYKMK